MERADEGGIEITVDNGEFDPFFPQIHVPDPLFPTSSAAAAASSDHNPILQFASSSSCSFSSGHNPIFQYGSSSSSSNQNHPILEPWFRQLRFQYPSPSLDPSSSNYGVSSSTDPYSSRHIDITSYLARLRIPDLGSSSLRHSRSPSPSLQFDNAAAAAAAYHSNLQHRAHELENRIRMREAQMASSSPTTYSSSPAFRDYRQGSMASAQISSPRNKYVCNCALCPSLQARDYNGSRGSVSNSSSELQWFPTRNRSPLASDSTYTESGMSGSRRARLLEYVSNSSLESSRRLILPLAKDQEGCRFLQAKVEEGVADDIDIIFSEVKDHVCDLMADPFGNYFVQKLFEVCDEEQRTAMLVVATDDVFEFASICLDAHGTRAVQKMLEHLTTPQQINRVISSLSPRIIDLVNHGNGHHVVERCLLNFSHEYTRCIIEQVADHCVDVAIHQNGCCVMQKCLTYSKDEQREHLLSEIIANAQLLSEDKFGNYVVQYVLEFGIPHVTAKIVKQLEGHYASLSTQKFGSNVVEKCLRLAQGEQRTRIIEELLKSPHPVQIMQDQFGNYVMQSALSFSKGLRIHAAIVDLVTSQLPALSSHPFGKRVVASMQCKKWRESRPLIHSKAALSFH